MINTRNLLCDSSKIHVTLTFKASKITLEGTDILFKGKTYSIPQSDAELIPTPYKSGLAGYIAHNPETEDTFLLVDHVVKDGKDLPFRFKDHGLTAIHLLFLIPNIPPNASNIEELEVLIYNVSTIE